MSPLTPEPATCITSKSTLKQFTQLTTLLISTLWKYQASKPSISLQPPSFLHLSPASQPSLPASQTHRSSWKPRQHHSTLLAPSDILVLRSWQPAQCQFCSNSFSSDHGKIKSQVRVISPSRKEEVRKEKVCCQDKGCGQWVHHGLSVQRRSSGFCLPCRINHSPIQQKFATPALQKLTLRYHPLWLISPATALWDWQDTAIKKQHSTPISCL